MENDVFVIERIYNAPVPVVWNALTNIDDMKKWYFRLDEFRPEEGFEFRFYGGTEEKQYLHLCKVTQVIQGKKIAYSWRYEGYEGKSEVCFELFPEGKNTRLKLSHTGLNTFPKNDPNFAEESFAAGWTYITGVSLKEYVEKNTQA